MRLLLVDNYDSFAFNLVQGFAALGAEVSVVRNDALTAEEALARSPDAIVLSPGPRGPADAGISVPLVLRAAAAGVPLLGVCLGHQAIVAAFGGEVVRGRRPVHGMTSAVRHDGSGLFEGLPDPLEAMRYHSLVAADPLPACLRVAAWTDDADRVPMAAFHRDLPVFGVQFHPESYLTAEGPRLLGRFLEIAERHVARAPDRAAPTAGAVGTRPYLAGSGSREGSAPGSSVRAGPDPEVVTRRDRSAPDPSTSFPAGTR